MASAYKKLPEYTHPDFVVIADVSHPQIYHRPTKSEWCCHIKLPGVNTPDHALASILAKTLNDWHGRLSSIVPDLI